MSLCPKGIRLSIKQLGAGDAVVVNTDNRFVKVAAAAMADVCKRETVFIRRSGASPPLASRPYRPCLPMISRMES